MPTKTPLHEQEFAITTLAKCFDTDPRTLVRRLQDDDVAMGAGGWTIPQAFEAMAGDGGLDALRASKKQLTDKQTEIADLELKERNGRLVDGEEFYKDLQPYVIEVRRIILSSKLSDDEKDAVMLQLSKAFEK